MLENSVNCGNDKINIFDGNSPTTPLINSLCGTSRPPDVTTSGNEAFVQFLSDGSMMSSHFSIEYIAIIPVQGKILSRTSMLREQYYYYMLFICDITYLKVKVLRVNGSVAASRLD